MRPTDDPARAARAADDTRDAAARAGRPDDAAAFVADVSAWDQRLPALLVRLGLALLGAGLIAIGALVDGGALARWVGANLSPDGAISPDTARQVASLRPLFLAAGFILLGLALAADWAIAAYRALEGAVLALVRLALRLAAAVARGASAVGSALAGILPARVVEASLLVLLLVLVVGMSWWARTTQPPFHAEGINLQPAKNLVLHGKYALRSYEGWDLQTFRITTGPGMLVPTAVAFAVFGIHPSVAHAVAIGFFVLFLLLTYFMLRPHLGGGTVLLGLLFFVLHPANIFFGASCGYVDGGMGEAPALAYLMLGLLLWASALARPSNGLLFLAGIFFGLSFQSKWLFLFALFAVIGSYAVLRLAGRRLPSRVYLLPALGLLAATAAFFLMRVSQFGLQGELAHLGRLWDQHMRRAVGFSTGEGQVESLFAVARPLVTVAQVGFWAMLGAFLTLPALAYAVVVLRRRLHPVPLYVLVFTLMWFAWWFLFSYDLPLQHILYIMPFVQIFAAKLVVDAWRAARQWRPDGRLVALRAAGIAVIALVVAGKTLVPLAQNVDQIYKGQQELAAPFAEFVAYVEANTEPDAIISGWNWSKPWWLSVEKDRTIKDRARVPFEQREKGPEYLVVTPEWPLAEIGTGWPDMAYRSRWTFKANARRKEFIAAHCTHLITTGTSRTWSLYRINPLPPPGDAAPAAASELRAP